MKNFFAGFLPFRAFELRTKLPKERVLKKAADVEPDAYSEKFYYSRICDDNIKICERFNKYYFGVCHTTNSFAPVLSARIEERDGHTVIKGTLRMNALVAILFTPIYLLFISLSLLCVYRVYRKKRSAKQRK